MCTPSQKLASVRIVLVEPAGDRNIGAISRVMKNFGLQQLILVNPQCDPHSEDAQHMAVHAAEVLAAAQIVPTLKEALKGKNLKRKQKRKKEIEKKMKKRKKKKKAKAKKEKPQNLKKPAEP